jgi:hypothetical protein
VTDEQRLNEMHDLLLRVVSDHAELVRQLAEDRAKAVADHAEQLRLMRQLVADRELVLYEVRKLQTRISVLESEPPEAA